MSPGTAAAAGTKRTARVAPVSGLVRSLAAGPRRNIFGDALRRRIRISPSFAAAALALSRFFKPVA